jgi:ATP-dependent RNA helicase HelY
MWASGKGLDEVLREAEMPAGDFVRWCKQVIDVLGQISAASPTAEGSTVAKAARKAVEQLLRGVVAYSSVG